MSEEELQRREHQEHIEMEELTDEQVAEMVGEVDPSPEGGVVERVVVRGKRKRDGD